MSPARTIRLPRRVSWAGCGSIGCCCPGATTLERDVAAVRDQAERGLWQTIASARDAAQRERLEGLLVVPYAANISGPERLRRAPASISAPGLLGALERLREIRAVGFGHLDAGDWSASRVAALARYGGAAKAQAIAQLSDTRRAATCSRPSSS